MRSEPRILIVDDDDAIRALLFTVLRRRGLRADSARNGIEALEKLAERSYALILLDLMMPEMSGYELLDHLHGHPTARPLIIVLTAGGEPRPKDTSLIIATLTKPFDVELLVDTIQACLNSLDAPIPHDESAASVNPEKIN